MSKSFDWADRVAEHCTAAGLPKPVREHKFSSWRIDIAWPAQKLAVEVHGATFVRGRHNTGTGLRRDAQKARSLVLHGWRLLTFSSDEFGSDDLIRSSVSEIAAAFHADTIAGTHAHHEREQLWAERRAAARAKKKPSATKGLFKAKRKRAAKGAA